MNETPHPLDDLDTDQPTDQFAERESFSGANAYKPLLKWSVYIAIGFAVVVVLARVASSNAPLNSPFAIVSDWVFFVSSICCAISCASILVAYRVPYFRQVLLRRDSKQHWLKSGFAVLSFTCLAALCVVWISYALFSTSFDPTIQLVASKAQILISALMATVLVYHKGYVRAFAIGFLVPQLLRGGDAVTALMMLLQGSRMGRNGPNLSPMAMQFAIDMSMLIVCGFVCALYVVIVEAAQRRMNSKTGEASDKPADDSHNIK